jgi:pimeloyl-ACP methyl ester carboxylesterase
MKLYYQTYPESLDINGLEQPPVIIIPGLFGSTSNWRSFAKLLSEDYPVIIVDQRNHGRSPHAGTQSYFDMSDDLLELLDTLGLEQAILVGHSMGGKVAMVFSLLHPERVSRLAILDIAPVVYSHSHAPFLEALLDIDLSELESRSAADKALQSAIPDTGTRLFLLQSLTGTAKNYQWRLNLSVLHTEMSKIVGFPSSQLEVMVNSVDACLIYGENSTYVTETEQAVVLTYFPQTEFFGIPKAGHWLHVEQPKLVLEALRTFLKNK